METKKETSRHAPDEIDAYLAPLPDDQRSALERLRQLIRETVPDCRERVSYGIPIFRTRRDLVGMSAWRNHCALHCMSKAVTTTVLQEWPDVEGAGGTIHFTPEKPLPKELIRRVLRLRLEEMGEV